jgi:hypothetical protein
MKKQRSPGPAAYNIKSTVCSDAPCYSFGTMKRPAPNSKGISPGPVYQLKASLGRNKDITFKALPAFGFGTSERPDPGGNSALREWRSVLPALAHPGCPPPLARPAQLAHGVSERGVMSSAGLCRSRLGSAPPATLNGPHAVVQHVVQHVCVVRYVQRRDALSVTASFVPPVTGPSLNRRCSPSLMWPCVR